MNGVLTYLFTKTIREYPGITYGGLLEKMHDEIKKINRSRCNNRILQHILIVKLNRLDPITIYCHYKISKVIYIHHHFLFSFSKAKNPCIYHLPYGFCPLQILFGLRERSYMLPTRGSSSISHT